MSPYANNKTIIVLESLHFILCVMKDVSNFVEINRMSNTSLKVSSYRQDYSVTCYLLTD